MSLIYAATNEAGTCLWCGRKVPQTSEQAPHFDTKDCAATFGMTFAAAGKRLAPAVQVRPTVAP